MTTEDLRVATLLELGSATLGETGGAPLPARIRALHEGVRIVAPAFTVQCTPGDNLAIHAAVACAPEEHVLVVAVGDEREYGYWGEVLTVAAQSRGLGGLVIDGGVRDSARIGHLRFPVFSAMVALRGATKQQPGSVGAPISIGGVTITAGDWVVGDADGVTVIARDRLDEVTDAGKARAAKEDEIFAGLRSGHTTIELLGLDTGPITKG
jgi:4-hydroxy-4-methyl-2-oxoglutarate aldolase